jgi:hypothetical protein
MLNVCLFLDYFQSLVAVVFPERLFASGHARYQQFFGLLPPELVAKTLLQNNLGEAICT